MGLTDFVVVVRDTATSPPPEVPPPSVFEHTPHLPSPIESSLGLVETSVKGSSDPLLFLVLSPTY